MSKYNRDTNTTKTIEMHQRITKCCAVPSCGKIQSLHWLPCDPNIRKACMNFIFNEVPNHVSKFSNHVSLFSSFYCDSFFLNSFLNKSQLIKNKRCADCIGPNSNVATHVWVIKFLPCFHHCFLIRDQTLAQTCMAEVFKTILHV